ncbi:MAG: DUF3034 family protein [Sedimentisphaerales bacterium]|nr:DUF3034 family protein [Sedimentisphaerales bacterium]
MKKVEHVAGVLFVAVLFLTIRDAGAGVPLTNLEGVGGIAFNPVAYPADPGSTLGDPNSDFGRLFGKPQIGAWYVNLGEAQVNWTSIGIAETFAKRLEVSYAHETIGVKGLTDDITKDDVGAKLLLIEENTGGNEWIPAVAAGIVGKHISNVPLANTDSSGYDVYLVATKLITSLPKPVLVSGGAVSTDSQVTGVFGYNDDRDITWFGNIDVLPVKDVAVGLEYKQGAEFDNFKNADYWDAHVAWFVNKNLTLVGAYVNAGNENSTSKVGLGEGVVLSIQYAF